MIVFLQAISTYDFMRIAFRAKVALSRSIYLRLNSVRRMFMSGIVSVDGLDPEKIRIFAMMSGIFNNHLVLVAQ